MAALRDLADSFLVRLGAVLLLAVASALLGGELGGAELEAKLGKKQRSLELVREERGDLRQILEFMAAKYEADLRACGCAIRGVAPIPAPSVSERTLEKIPLEQRALVPEVETR